jgi:hypothetical protein
VLYTRTQIYSRPKPLTQEHHRLHMLKLNASDPPPQHWVWRGVLSISRPMCSPFIYNIHIMHTGSLFLSFPKVSNKTECSPIHENFRGKNTKPTEKITKYFSCRISSTADSNSFKNTLKCQQTIRVTMELIFYGNLAMKSNPLLTEHRSCCSTLMFSKVVGLRLLLGLMHLM